MKKIFSLAVVLFLVNNIKAQNVGIGTSSPNASAQLHINSTTKGLLIPRLTAAQRTAIPSPATGLLVYEITTNSFWYYNSAAWEQIGTAGASTWSVSNNDIFNSNTGNVGIGISVPTAKLHVGDSSVVFSATGVIPVTQGNPPVSSGGRRMMWYADKAAFRVGYVSTTNWNKDSIGQYSFAAGYDTKAKGFAAVAMGDGATATGNTSIAMGENVISSSSSSVALGVNTTASGAWAFASGTGTTAAGNGSTAMGYSNSATGFAATAIGESSLAIGTGSFSTGRSTNAHGSYSVSMGYFSDAFGFGSVALGRETISYGDQSLAIGNRSYATAANSLVVGSYNDTLVTRETLSGINTPASPLFTVGNGTGTSARKNAFVVRYDGKTAIGVKIPQTLLHQDEGNALATYHKFTAGTTTGQLSTDGFDLGIDGSGNAELKQRENKHLRFYTNNSLRIKVDSSGRTGIGTDLPLARLHVADSSVVFFANGNIPATPGNTPAVAGGRGMMWYADKAAFRAGYVLGSGWDKDNIGDYSIATGQSTEASGISANASGTGTAASGDYSVASGHITTASGINSNASGYFTEATGDYSVASGDGTEASGLRSFASGFNSIAKGYTSLATGFNSIAQGDNSATLNYNTQANGYASTVVGRYNDTIVAAQTFATANTPLFIVGNGTSNANRSNAITVLQSGNIGIATTQPNTRLDVNGDFSMRENNLFLANGNNHNLAVGLSSFANVSNVTGNYTITGISAGVDGKIFTIVNSSPFNLTIAHLDAGSDPANRINTLAGANISTIGNGSFTFQYSTIQNRWMVIAFRE
jgi:hypothetical protein